VIRKNNKFDDLDEGVRLQDIDNLPFPDFSDFDLDKYPLCIEHKPDLSFRSNALPILLSRGCSQKCDFCLQRVLWHDKFITRKAEDVFAEMIRDKEIYEVNRFVFSDLLINGDLKELEKLCDRIINEGFSFEWWGSVKIDPRMDVNLLRKMKKAGCFRLSLGVESGSDKVLRAMHKPFTTQMVRKFFKEVNDSEIHITFNIIVGHPSETRKDFIDTLKFLKETKDLVRLGPSPTLCAFFEGTDMYNEYSSKPEFKFMDPLNWEYKDNTLKEREYRLNILKKYCLTLFGSFNMVV